MTNKYMWLSIDDMFDMFEEKNIPADGLRRLVTKHHDSVILEVVSLGHHLESIKKGNEVVGLVVRDHRDLLWRARIELGYSDIWFPDAIRGFVKFTRVTESALVARVFTEVP